MDEGSLPAHPQGWCPRHRRCDGGRLCAKPGSQSLGSPGAHQVWPLSSAAGPEGIHSEDGWIASATRHSDMAFIVHLTQFEFGNDGVCEGKWQSIPVVRDLSCR